MLTYGFYNSVNHDRKYNAIQMSNIFDGIIRDGIFMSIGERFVVTAEGSDMFIIVGSGRAWFNHTWTLNDAPLLLEVPQSELLLNRYDAVVLEVNFDQETRANAIKIVKGTPSSAPVYPTMVNTNTVHQYPLAYIYVEKNVTTIRQADITSMIGQQSTPYVTAPLETIDIEEMVAQWEDQWTEFFEKQTSDMTSTNAYWKAQWQEWMTGYQEEMNQTADGWKDLWDEWFYAYINQSQNGLDEWIETTEDLFDTWWDSIKTILDENCCSNLAARVLELEKQNAELEKFKDNLVNRLEIYMPIYDTNYDAIISELTNQDGITLTNQDDEVFDVIGYSSEPILDDTMKPVEGAVKIALAY